MKKKLNLNIKSEFPDKFIGISSHFKDIQIAWTINNIMNFNFVKTTDFIKKHKKSDISYNFSLFQYSDEQIRHYLIANKNKDTILFPQYKTIDYIYISNLPTEKLNLFVNKISKSKMIIGSFIMPANTISKTLEELFEE